MAAHPDDDRNRSTRLAPRGSARNARRHRRNLKWLGDGAGPYAFSTDFDLGTTAAYALPIADRTLCVYLRWDSATTPEELDAARAVVDSIRGEPHEEQGIRIVFTLPAGWDTG
jgi:hypothetical protein